MVAKVLLVSDLPINRAEDAKFLRISDQTWRCLVLMAARGAAGEGINDALHAFGFSSTSIHAARKIIEAEADQP